jgi:hypothetical protein
MRGKMELFMRTAYVVALLVPFVVRLVEKFLLKP